MEVCTVPMQSHAAGWVLVPCPFTAGQGGMWVPAASTEEETPHGKTLSPTPILTFQDCPAHPRCCDRQKHPACFQMLVRGLV